MAEAVEATKSFQIQPIEIIHQGIQVDAPLHLSLSDASGDSAIIEVLDGEPHIHHGSQYTVMTNSPVYEEQLVLLKQYEGLGGKKPIPGTFEAEDRFARGAFFLSKLAPNSYQQAVAGVLRVIRNMAIPPVPLDPARPNIAQTIWRTIGDCTNKRYYLEFTDMPNVVWTDFDKLNFDVGAPVKVFNLAGDFEASGEISGKFKPSDPVRFQKAGTAVTWTPDS